jgi:hypothetical protein
MRDALIATVLVGVLTISIWWNYRLFMRGNWPEQKAKSLLPKDFKPDFFYVRADTYIGYDKSSNKLALVEMQRLKIVQPKDIISVEPKEERILGVKHQWLIINVRDQAFPQYGIWFGFNRQQRDEWLRRVKELTA